MADITTYSLVTLPSAPSVPSAYATMRAGTLRTVVGLPGTTVLPTALSIRTGQPFTLGNSVFTAGAMTIRKLRGWVTSSGTYVYWAEGSSTPVGVDLTSITAVGKM